MSRPRKPGHVELERALSKLGIASRTQAREWILAGWVRVDGIIRTSPLFQVVPERAKIQVEGKELQAAAPKYLLLHKPKGVITTRSDEKGRPTVFSLVEKKGIHLIAVGRLDWATSGLLILTNDTKFSAWLTDPANGVKRIYLVTVRGEVTDEKTRKAMKGFEDQGETIQADEVSVRKASRKESHLTVTLKEGKNREIRRMFLALGHEVTRLKRVSYGGLELGELPPAAYRELAPQELAEAFPGAPLRAACQSDADR